MKRLIATIRLTLLANRAAPSPILGQALGQYGINMATFCKTFNDKTKNIKEHVYIPTRIEVFSSRLSGNAQNSFEITIKSPTSTYLLKQTANLLKGSSSRKEISSPLRSDASNEPASKKNTYDGWFILAKEIYHLALFKLVKLSSIHDLKATSKTLIGSAKSIGLSLISDLSARRKHLVSASEK